jgi:hypothetical protein
MALWGAPVIHPDDPVLCVSCALEQMEVLGKFNRRRIDNGQPPLAIGIGIHTGPLVAGYIGSSKALSYTVIGDTCEHQCAPVRRRHGRSSPRERRRARAALRQSSRCRSSHR